MSAKKWFFMFMAALLAACAVWAGANVLVDPFNAFGNTAFSWDAYDMTNNPRVAKVAYLEAHRDEFDSFIIGSSSAASYDINKLNELTGASFYNLFVYGTDTTYYAALAEYLLENYQVKNIILNVAINEANFYEKEDSLNTRAHIAVSGQNPLVYYGKYLFASPDYALEKLRSFGEDSLLPRLFDVFVPETGSYDKRVRDVEPISSLEDYLHVNPSFDDQKSPESLSNIDECIDNVAEIKRLCDEGGVNLTVIFSPVCFRQLEGYSHWTLTEYMEKLADVTDYWNFSVSGLSYDERYFYDSTHMRNAAGDMVLARVFGSGNVYIPEDFGTYVTRDNVSEFCERVLSQSPSPDYSDYTAKVPVLIYHDVSEAEGEFSVTPESFERQMRCLYDNGYTAVGLRDLERYVLYGEDLPEKPVLITFDDGYYSNYEYAYPVLSELGFKAVIFPIGVSVGHMEYYKDTDFAMTPHFGIEEMEEMLASGLIDFQSHTFDMHQWAPFETGSVIRESILMLPGETESGYVSALENDFSTEAAILGQAGVDRVYALAFPGGRTSVLTNAALKDLGIAITFTTNDQKVNVLVKGLPQSLLELGRKEPHNSTTDSELLEYLSGY